MSTPSANGRKYHAHARGHTCIKAYTHPLTDARTHARMRHRVIGDLSNAVGVAPMHSMRPLQHCPVAGRKLDGQLRCECRALEHPSSAPESPRVPCEYLNSQARELERQLRAEIAAQQARHWPGTGHWAGPQLGSVYVRTWFDV